MDEAANEMNEGQNGGIQAGRLGCWSRYLILRGQQVDEETGDSKYTRCNNMQGQWAE